MTFIGNLKNMLEPTNCDDSVISIRRCDLMVISTHARSHRRRRCAAAIKKLAAYSRAGENKVDTRASYTYVRAYVRACAECR